MPMNIFHNISDIATSFFYVLPLTPLCNIFDGFSLHSLLSRRCRYNHMKEVIDDIEMRAVTHRYIVMKFVSYITCSMNMFLVM